MRLLLVDDEASILEMMSEYLRETGHQVETASSVREASERIFRKKETFDVVITDRRMPNGDGLELMKKIQKQSAQLPVILISGDLNRKHTEFFFDGQKYFFLSKPFEWEELESILFQIAKNE